MLVHGRLDMGGPLETAWELAKAWPGAELKIVEDSGHHGSATTVTHVREASGRYFGANIAIITSGAFSHQALIVTIGIDTVMFAIDYPVRVNRAIGRVHVHRATRPR